jgi:uncharacterized protein (DUF2249 family)
MTINAQTRIATLLKHRPEALDAIVGLSPRFVKLRNPVLRKMIAGRTSIAMAAKMGGCSVQDFYSCLSPLGFDCDVVVETADVKESQDAVPEFLTSIDKSQIRELDVRPYIEKGEDPLTVIMHTIKTMQPGEVFRLVNSFEPLPLIYLLEKQGYEAFTETISDEKVLTWFYKKTMLPKPAAPDNFTDDDWTLQQDRFAGQMQNLDVRELEMPLPMLRILEKLEALNEGQALFVYHKRIPIFLLPELKDRGFQFRARKLGENEVHLLIFRN